MLFSNRHLLGHCQEILQTGITCIPSFLTKETRKNLLTELSSTPLEDAKPLVGPHNIKQSYTFTTDFDEQGTFCAVRDVLQTQLNGTAKDLLSEPLSFTDLVTQTYTPPCPVGISPHRDGLKYLNIVAVFILEGSGRFCMCDDREGSNPREIQNEPGDLLLMRAPGFGGGDIQPFHFVNEIKTKRTSFALRHTRT
ncbi:MAG: hypothetical protein ACI9H6_000433 [Patiriisocius sp.]|jgi:hypothetical protein